MVIVGLSGLITGVLRTTPAMRLNIVSNASVIVGYGEMLRCAFRKMVYSQDWCSPCNAMYCDVM